MKTPSSSSKPTNPTMASGSSWSKYINVLGLLGFIFAILSASPMPAVSSMSLGNIPFLSRLNDFLTKKPENDVVDEAAKYEHGCPQHHFDSVKIASRTPDIMVIEGFLTKFEAEYLIKLAEPIFQDSRTVAYHSSGDNEVDKSYRSSMSAYLPLSHEGDYKVLRCIEERAANLQGHVPISRMENLQVVKYEKGQYFRPHYDWFDPEKDKTLGVAGNRETSIFVYLVAQCEGGTTTFPNVRRPAAPEWCDILKCEDKDGNPVEQFEVMAKEGTAIFWHNFETSGKLDVLTLHAGTDVLNGSKIGLNIWTREKNFRNV